MRRRVRGSMRTVRRERGVALIFVIGLLSLLLCIGLAFVANAIGSLKIARNNSARTQAKILALAAVSRTAGAIMLYQEQLNVTDPTALLSEKFSGVYSYSDGSGVIVSGNAEERRELMTDGLLGERSLMMLPEDDSGVSRAEAHAFNACFRKNALFPWKGTWVYFFNTTADDSERRIIGRAAWQTVTPSAQLLAPVFFRGAFSEVPGSMDKPAQACRWGRDVHEADLTGCRLFRYVGDNYNGDHIEDFEGCIAQGWLLAENDGDRRWIERWLALDPNSELGRNAAWEPNATQMVPETYSCQPENSTKKNVLCRFNVSDLYTPGMTKAQILAKYGVSADADPWYARFRIDSTSSADLNGEKALEELTRDSARYYPFQYDYELTAPEERSGLPFLRRIGNTPGTFGDVAALRKQIAANFNDYCDADSVPTSDVPAADWKISAQEPQFTGNEKTPYLYELGALAAIVQEAGTSITDDQPGIRCTLSPNTGTAARKMDFSCALRLSPVVKLATLYTVKESKECKNLQAEMVFSEVSASCKIRQITLRGMKISYRLNKRNYTKKLNDFTVAIGSADWQDYASLRALDLANWVLSVSAKDDGITAGEALSFPAASWDNGDGFAPYPLRYFSQDSNDSCGDLNTGVWHTAAALQCSTRHAQSGATALPELLFSTEEMLKMAAAQGVLPESYTNFKIVSQPTELIVDKIALTAFSLRPGRVLLSAERELKNGGTGRFGVDYVKAFQTYPFVWNSEDGIELFFSASSKKGILFGGICNYDPRQNLNNADWYPYPEKGETALKAMAKATLLQNYGQPGTAEINAVICKNGVNAPDGMSAAFQPSAQSDDENRSSPGDRELSSCTGPGRTATSALSTAVIRNAPMMSPWEIGMIHRGVRWQTINLKGAGDPDDPDLPIRPSSYTPNGSAWNKTGTDYRCGDAALLDQIKMSQRGGSYGKIDLNMLFAGDPGFDALRDTDIFRALFDGIFYGEDTESFIRHSTREDDGNFAEQSSGKGVLRVPEGSAPESFRRMTDGTAPFPKTEKNQPDSRRYASRAQVVDYLNGTAQLANAFGLVPAVMQDDAHMEEIIGKTINLLTADSTAPDKIYLVVVAQTIRDGAGTHYLLSSGSRSDFLTTNGETLQAYPDNLFSLPCQYGRFDAAIHQDDPAKSLYFDSITGEVKLFVTLNRDPVTGRVSIGKINYLE